MSPKTAPGPTTAGATRASSRPAVESGRLIVIAAPSGAGKTSLVHALLERVPQLKFSTSYTTRPPRPAEVPGQDYFFVSVEQFQSMRAEGAFLEHAQVFDNWYGTGKAHVGALLAQGYPVLLEIDWQGARQIRAAAPEALTVFVMPPSVAELERRLRGRATDSEATIARRLRDALDDMAHWTEFGYVIVNDDLGTAADELERIVMGDGSASLTTHPDVRRKITEILGT